MIDLVGLSVSAEERILLSQSHVGGVILFSRNIESRDQVCDLVVQIRACSSDLLIAVDQEGGRVQRLRDGFTRLPTMQLLGDIMAVSTDKGASLSYETGWLMASEVLACGIDFSFAPVLDVDRDTSSIIGDRAFSDCPIIVEKAAEAFIDGMSEAGMASTGKHFPGHGGIVADSHLEAPIDNRDLEDLLNKDLKPFSALAKKLQIPLLLLPGKASLELGQALNAKRTSVLLFCAPPITSSDGASIEGGNCEQRRNTRNAISSFVSFIKDQVPGMSEQ